MNNNLEVQVCSWSWRIVVHKMKPTEKTDKNIETQSVVW